MASSTTLFSLYVTQVNCKLSVCKLLHSCYWSHSLEGLTDLSYRSMKCRGQLFLRINDSDIKSERMLRSKASDQ